MNFLLKEYMINLIMISERKGPNIYLNDDVNSVILNFR